LLPIAFKTKSRFVWLVVGCLANGCLKACERVAGGVSEAAEVVRPNQTHDLPESELTVALVFKLRQRANAESTNVSADSFDADRTLRNIASVSNGVVLPIVRSTEMVLSRMDGWTFGLGRATA
jgi:hypothetical protein